MPRSEMTNAPATSATRIPARPESTPVEKTRDDSTANRLTLNGDEREALASAYALLGEIARRHGLDNPDERQTA